MRSLGMCASWISSLISTRYEQMYRELERTVEEAGLPLSFLVPLSLRDGFNLLYPTCYVLVSEKLSLVYRFNSLT